MDMDVLTYCERAFTQRGYTPDATQRAAMERLQRCYTEWLEYAAHQTHFWKRWIRTVPPPKGVYLWGGVGRGKSFLMDAFYACVPIKQRIRMHFHEFMREVHQQLRTLKGRTDPLDVLARRMAKQYRLICFDEFHITDIADAMLLHRLLHALFKEGVQFVMTSNDRPDGLYPDGLHRERMLNAIALLYEKLDVLNVDGGRDYRQIPTAQAAVDNAQASLAAPFDPSHPVGYHVPSGPQADAALLAIFRVLTHTAAPSADTLEAPVVLHIEHRSVPAYACVAGVVWFDFQVLCGAARSQNDYLEIARRFHTVIVSNLPQFTEDQALPARRFTWLIDVLYDTPTRLILSATVELPKLYACSTLARQGVRTLSRVVEMQTQRYWLNAGKRA